MSVTTWTGQKRPCCPLWIEDRVLERLVESRSNSEAVFAKANVKLFFTFRRRLSYLN